MAESPQKFRPQSKEGSIAGQEFRHYVYTGFLRVRRDLLKSGGSIVDTQSKVRQTLSDLGYANETETISTAVMEEVLRRMGVAFDKDDVSCFLQMSANPDTQNIHMHDIIRAIEVIDTQRALFGIQKQPSNRNLGDGDSEKCQRPYSIPSSSAAVPNLNASTLLQMRSCVQQVPTVKANELPVKTSMQQDHAAQPDTSMFSNMYQRVVDAVVAKEKPKKEPMDIEDFLGESYIDNTNQNRFSSNALDVLALYIKGQKLLYTESKTYCEQQLNFLMLPAIFISCVGSIFSFLSGRYNNGDLIIASLNGFNAFLLALISYLKLDAKAQAHKTSAYKFDKLESMCEFNSGKFMFFNTTQLDIMDVVKQIEKEVKEIKETNQFILPETIRYEFSFTYTTNVFMLVKKIQATEIAETNNLANLIRLLDADFNNYGELDPQSGEAVALKAEIDAKIKKQNKYLEKILKCREEYFNLDKGFAEEIEKHIARSNRWFIFRLLCCDWLKS